MYSAQIAMTSHNFVQEDAVIVAYLQCTSGQTTLGHMYVNQKLFLEIILTY